MTNVTKFRKTSGQNSTSEYTVVGKKGPIQLTNVVPETTNVSKGGNLTKIRQACRENYTSEYN